MKDADHQHEISERLKLVFVSLIEKKRIRNKVEFAKILRINRITVRSYLDEGREPSVPFLLKLHENFSICMNWLLSGKGAMYLDDEEEKLHENFRKLDQHEKIMLIARAELLPKEQLEELRLNQTLSEFDLEDEKKAILSLRSNGQLKNMQFERIELYVLNHLAKADSKKTSPVTPKAMLKTQKLNFWKKKNHTIREFVEGKSNSFQKMLSRVSKIEFRE